MYIPKLYFSMHGSLDEMVQRLFSFFYFTELLSGPGKTILSKKWTDLLARTSPDASKIEVTFSLSLIEAGKQ